MDKSSRVVLPWPATVFFAASGTVLVTVLAEVFLGGVSHLKSSGKRCFEGRRTREAWEKAVWIVADVIVEEIISDFVEAFSVV